MSARDTTTHTHYVSSPDFVQPGSSAEDHPTLKMFFIVMILILIVVITAAIGFLIESFFCNLGAPTSRWSAFKNFFLQFLLNIVFVGIASFIATQMRPFICKHLACSSWLPTLMVGGVSVIALLMQASLFTNLKSAVKMTPKTA